MNTKISKKTPMRRCIGCMESKDKETLIRFVLRDGVIQADPKKILPGRGFYLCPSEKCLEMALKRKAFQRILKGPLTEADLERIRKDIQEE